MNMKSITIESINPAPYNPREDLQPEDPRFQKLQQSVEEFGLVWNSQTGNLVGGHQRLKVLIANGETQDPVVVVDLTPDKEKALNLALNKIQGGWDDTKLAELLDGLIDSEEVDLDLTGFEVDEAQDLIDRLLDGITGVEDEQDVDHVPNTSSEPVTRPGDLILLGRDPASQHRLLCGDSTDPEQVRMLMDGQRAVLFATDPPYLVDYNGTNHPGGRSKKGKRNAPKDWSDSYGKTWDDASANPELYEKFVRAAVEEAVAPNAAWYCWHASRRQAMLEAAWEKAGAFVHCQIIWTKNKGVPTRTWYLWRHEPCFMGWLRGSPPARRDETRLPTVWEIDTIPNGADRPDHPTPKPLEVFEWPMRQHTRRGEICYEPFAGSGQQVIAAQKLGRRCFAIEISPAYCDLIVRRYIKLAGEDAVEPEVAERYRVEHVSNQPDVEPGEGEAA
ncbi:MAG: hypothetical protein NCW75_03930 [Phycisphaera sp.]|nr:MAG: hypothetical protein NCW75_03930 [Phycisphaera sp.]